MPLSQDAERLLQDAVNLQIDTVVKSAMTGRSMPSFPYALIDLARAYTRKLQALQPAAGTAAHGDGQTLAVDLPFIFNSCLENAPWAPRAAEGCLLVAERDRIVLERLRAGCDVAKTLIGRLYQTASDGARSFAC